MTSDDFIAMVKELGLCGELVALNTIKANPNNPRVIKDERFEKLKNSIREFPKMMALRPMVVDEDGVVLGGNMRLRALQALGYRYIPVEWVKDAASLTAKEKERFIIEDNIPFGEWDWDELANEWDENELSEWGLEVWHDVDEKTGESQPPKEDYKVVIQCETEAEQQRLQIELQRRGFVVK